ncbi:hypothetical protein [Salmonella phage SD-14_S20]|nr:hypothetical protein [Salmonella phage SD-12_S18]WPK20437.1 hypothetical protein [Salmonella phage SD-14_S20]
MSGCIASRVYTPIGNVVFTFCEGVRVCGCSV